MREFIFLLSRSETGTICSIDITGEGGYSVWAKGNMPKVCETEDYVVQKISYIHYNPVRKQYVRNPEDWRWSSANPESDIPVKPLWV
jgi:REP element-mobilizing transposase RayT